MLFKWEQEEKEVSGHKFEKKFDGYIEVEIPKYVQRLKYIKECNFKVSKDGQVDSTTDSIDAIIKMIEIAQKHVKKVDLKHISSGKKYASWEELEQDPETDIIMNDISSVVLNGPSLGKQ